MHTSQTLKELVIRNYQTHGMAGGSVNVVQDFYTRQNGLLFIGTDPAERFEGYSNLLDYISKNTSGGMNIQIKFLDAFEQGEMGWSFDEIELILSDGTKLPLRHTHVFERENGAWRIVHTHISFALPDKDLIRLAKENRI